MFADATEAAREFTRPLILAARFYDGTTQAGIAASVVLNSDGWLLTAAHVFDQVVGQQQHAQEMTAYEATAEAIRNNKKFKSGDRHRELRKLRPNDRWITHQSVTSPDGATILQWIAASDIDLAVLRVQPFQPPTVYPQFISSRPLRQATSLCRLGYPFLDFACTFDQAHNAFAVNASNITFFPNEGIYTREIIGTQSPHGPFQARFVETSSPGLRGQSGGPVYDARGVVWGIQSLTQHLHLGFNANLPVGGVKTVEVHQFMNVGWAVHPQTIHEFLTHHGIRFATTP